MGLPLAELNNVLEQLPFMTITYDDGGQILLRTGSLRRIVGRVLPSLEEKQRARWQIQQQGEILMPEDWPSKCALRGETHVKSFDARYRDSHGGADRNFQIVSCPLIDARGARGGVSLLLETDTDMALAHDIALYREPRFVEGFFQNFATAWQAPDTEKVCRAMAALKRGLAV